MGPEDIKHWQRYLNKLGFKGVGGGALTVDGQFGPNSQAAMSHFQAANGLPVTGIIDDASLKLATGAVWEACKANGEYGDIPGIPLVPAKWYTPAHRTEIKWVVIHDMEAPEGPRTAENVANYFANPRDKDGNPVKASAHYNCDVDSVVQSVLEKDVAWHAEDANRFGIGVEHAGYARQTREEWLDEYSTATLKRSAELVAGICKRWGIPIQWCEADDLKAGTPGITGHVTVNLAFENGHGHSDPGISFPKDQYLQWVTDAYANL